MEARLAEHFCLTLFMCVPQQMCLSISNMRFLRLRVTNSGRGNSANTPLITSM